MFKDHRPTFRNPNSEIILSYVWVLNVQYKKLVFLSMCCVTDDNNRWTIWDLTYYPKFMTIGEGQNIDRLCLVTQISLLHKGPVQHLHYCWCCANPPVNLILLLSKKPRYLKSFICSSNSFPTQREQSKPWPQTKRWHKESHLSHFTPFKWVLKVMVWWCQLHVKLSENQEKNIPKVLETKVTSSNLLFCLTHSPKSRHVWYKRDKNSSLTQPGLGQWCVVWSHLIWFGLVCSEMFRYSLCFSSLVCSSLLWSGPYAPLQNVLVDQFNTL